MKKNILIFIAGMICAGVLGALVVTHHVPGLGQAKEFATKVVQKLKDRKYNRAPKATQDLLLFDFEKPDELGKWKLNQATAELVSEHKTQGNQCLKVSLTENVTVSGIKLSDYFYTPQAVKNWAGYQSIVLDIYNPQNRQVRLIVQVKDKKERKVKLDVFLEPQMNNTVEVEVSRLRHALDIFNIGDFSLFEWDPKQKTILYIDNVRLTAFGQNEKATIIDESMIESPERAWAFDDYFAFAHKERWARPTTDGSHEVVLPLILVNETQMDLPQLTYSAGIPFPQSELTSSAQMNIFDESGTPYDFQARPLCKWPDGSIKWLLVDLPSEVPAASLKRFIIQYGSGIRKKEPMSTLKVAEDEKEIVVDTGVLKFIVKKHNFNLFDKVWLNGNIISNDNDLVVGFKGREYSSSRFKDSQVVTEEQGPLKATIKAEGWFVNEKGEKFCKYVVRLQAFAGASYVRVYHTFIYTGYPENKFHYLYKGKMLPKNEPIDEVTVKMPLYDLTQAKYSFEADGKVMQADLASDIQLFQSNYNVFSVNKAAQQLLGGKQISGWLDVSTEKGGLCVGTKDFWQQYPKEYQIDTKNGRLVISLWPKQAGPLDLKTTELSYGPEAVSRGSAFGLAKTHEFVLYFHNGPYSAAKPRNTVIGLLQPIALRVSPAWLSDTAVVGQLWSYDSRFGQAEEVLDRLFEWGSRQPENFHWYGMLDFGDTLSWYRRESYDKDYDEWGWHPEGRWGWFNCEGVGTHAAALLEYARTSRSKYFRFGENLARHIMDVDTCHFNTIAYDKRLKGKIFQDYSQPGSTHRHNGNHWGGRNEEASHTNLNGILLYYYLTGYERALDVAKEMGEFFLKEPITYFRHPDIAPHRGIANILWGETALYEATADPRYKQAADKWANLFFRGQRSNGSWAEDYNPAEKRWDGDPHNGYIGGYTLPALITYHQLTRNKAIKQSIVRGTLYLMKSDEYSHPFDAIAYSYWLTGDKRFKEEGSRRLDHLIGHQNRSREPLMDGMIYQKGIYARVVDFLYRTPFIFAVVNDSN